MLFIICDYFFFFDQINKTIIRIKKNNAVPRYAKKLSSGLGKRNKTSVPIRIIKEIKILIFFIYNMG